MDFVEYKILVKNLSDNDILLDNLKNDYTLALIGSNGASYKLDKTNLKSINLSINSNSKTEFTVKFLKQYGSNVTDNYITFKKVILDYSEYKKNKENYDNYKEININL